MKWKMELNKLMSIFQRKIEKNNKFAKAADVVMKEQKVLSIVDKGSNHRDDTPINNTGFNLNNTNTIDLEQNGQPLLATEKK